MERIGGETMVLYSDLRERLEISEAMRSINTLNGSFTTKVLGGAKYHYFQATITGARRQFYIGPDTDEVRRLIATKEEGEKDARSDSLMLQRLSAQIMAGGVPPVEPDMGRVINRLADCGVFRVGGIIVGTIAFRIIGTHIGVLWEGSSYTTQDVDLATDTGISLAVPDVQADVPAAIESLKMGFFPVPQLSHKEPSTSWAIRGKTLRLDLLTPLKRDQTAPVYIKRLNAAAQPLKYLGYLLESPINAVMLAGTPCLVRIPQPARYALHKLIISGERWQTAADKKRKDLRQAHCLLSLLAEDRPGDIMLAWEALRLRGSGWVKKMIGGYGEASGMFGSIAVVEGLIATSHDSESGISSGEPSRLPGRGADESGQSRKMDLVENSETSGGSRPVEATTPRIP